MRTLFARIEEILSGETIPGWCSVEKAQTLAALVVALRPQTSVEIGVFGGRSFFPLALAHHKIGCGTVLGIDPWEAEASAAGQDPANAEWWRASVDYEVIYQDFMRRIGSLGVADRAIVARKKSDDVEPPATIGLLHVDGNHGEQAMRDVRRFSPHVSAGGVCILDDLDWGGGAVRASEKFLLSNGFKMLYPLGTGAAYQRQAC